MITPQDLIPYYNISEEFEKTQKLIVKFEQLKKIRTPFYLERDDFEDVLKWKLRNQYGRKKKHRDERLNNEIIKKITTIALNFIHENEEFEIEYRLRLLSVLPGVDIPVASSILTLCFPKKYGVIDFRVWRTLFPRKKYNISAKNYILYLRKIREFAKELDWTPQEVDLAIWEYDRSK